MNRESPRPTATPDDRPRVASGRLALAETPGTGESAAPRGALALGDSTSELENSAETKGIPTETAPRRPRS